MTGVTRRSYLNASALVFPPDHLINFTVPAPDGMGWCSICQTLVTQEAWAGEKCSGLPVEEAR